MVASQIRQFICEEILERPDHPLRMDEPLISGGLMDSFALAQFAVFVEDTFGVSIPDNRLTMKDLDTINAMVDMVLSFKDES